VAIIFDKMTEEYLEKTHLFAQIYESNHKNLNYFCSLQKL